MSCLELVRNRITSLPSVAIAREVAIDALKFLERLNMLELLARERGGPLFDAVVTQSLKQQIRLVPALVAVGLPMPAMVVLARIAADAVRRGVLTRDEAFTLVNDVQRNPAKKSALGSNVGGNAEIIVHLGGDVGITLPQDDKTSKQVVNKLAVIVRNTIDMVVGETVAPSSVGLLKAMGSGSVSSGTRMRRPSTRLSIWGWMRLRSPMAVSGSSSFGIWSAGASAGASAVGTGCKCAIRRA